MFLINETCLEMFDFCYYTRFTEFFYILDFTSSFSQLIGVSYYLLSGYYPLKNYTVSKRHIIPFIS